MVKIEPRKIRQVRQHMAETAEKREIAAFKGAGGNEFLKAQFTGKNESGFRPIGAEMMVLMDRSVDRTAGNIIVPETYQDRMNVSSESGVIVALGSAAFASLPEHERPAVGARVIVEKFSGREFQGRDGQIYRIMTFTCVGAIEEDEAAPKKSRKAKA